MKMPSPSLGEDSWLVREMNPALLSVEKIDRSSSDDDGDSD